MRESEEGDQITSDGRTQRGEGRWGSGEIIGEVGDRP